MKSLHMKLLLLKWRKGLLIGVGALLLSTLGLQASDEWQGIEGRLSGAVVTSEGVCGTNAVQIPYGDHAVCMDKYEASPGEECVYMETESELHSQSNIARVACVPRSVSGVLPWRFVTYTQAQQLCARAGKRLPKNEEWYKVAIGLAEVSGCFVDKSKPAQTGAGACVTPTGIHNMVGNVWEWVDETVIDGKYQGRGLPESGYITLVDAAGVVIETSGHADVNFGSDYAWVHGEGVRGILRGGFYGSGNDGGVFTQNMAAQLNFAAAGVGFRCVQDIW